MYISEYVQYFILLRNMEKNIETLFIISSPFQAICAYEAISEFKIESYVFLVLLTPDDRRKEQIFFFLNTKKIAYEVILLERISLRRLINSTYLIRKEIEIRFRRIFIGDYFDKRHLYTAVILSKPNSGITFLDDGASSLLVFLRKNPYGFAYKLKRGLLLFCLDIKRVKHNTFFSLFNIPTNKFRIIHNRLSMFRNDVMMPQFKIACIIGTYVDEYCASYGIEVEQFLSSFKDILVEFKAEYDTIIFSPHGRCNNVETIEICEKLGVEVRYSKISVEYDYLCDKIYPQLIVAFDSTALYTLKSIFSDSKCINIQFLRKGISFNDYAEKNAKHLRENYNIDTRQVLVDKDDCKN